MRRREHQAMDQSRGSAQVADGEKSGPEDDEPLFSAVLTPHRSLSPNGFFLLMAAVAAVSFTAGIAFLMAGAWPVLGFFGLDVLLVYWAFRVNYRSARLYEQVNLTSDRLTLTRVSPSGREKSWEFNPYWVRCHILARSGRASQLSLRSHGKTLIFGSFLSSEEKEDFATSLSGALQDARGGVRI